MVDFSGIDIKVDDIIEGLRRDLRFNEICRQVLSLDIIHREAAQRALEVSEEEIQSEGDSIRRELRLESAEKTLEWLNEQHLSAAEWEQSIRDRILTQKLSDAMFKKAARAEFEQNRLDYEQAALYRIVVPNSEIAQELLYQIEEEETNFFEAAHRHNSDPLQRAYCGYEGQVTRWAMEPDIAASVFGANAHDVIGPIAVDKGYALLFVDKFLAPELTDETYQQIRDRKFQLWLDTEIQRLRP
ncbi:MAG: peptidylprolyl isomerase [Phormidesmis sp.]